MSLISLPFSVIKVLILADILHEYDLTRQKTWKVSNLASFGDLANSHNDLCSSPPVQVQIRISINIVCSAWFFTSDVSIEALSETMLWNTSLLPSSTIFTNITVSVSHSINPILRVITALQYPASREKGENYEGEKRDDSPVALVMFYICGGLRGCHLYETHTCAHVHDCICKFKHAQMHILLIYTLVPFPQCISPILSFSVTHRHT